LHSLEEFSKLKPKDIPRELEEYLCFVAKTGDPVYQWSAIKSLFREKLINVITEFYETRDTVIGIPQYPNVEAFNYDNMKSFILEKLDTFVAAPFTIQRICELLTTPRKEYNRIDKYMRALEKNILVVSTTEPGNQRNSENGDGFVNGIETEHLQDSHNDINIDEMDDTSSWSEPTQGSVLFQNSSRTEMIIDSATTETPESSEGITNSNLDTVITCCTSEQSYVSTILWKGKSTFQSTSKTEMVIEGCNVENAGENGTEADSDNDKKIIVSCSEETNVTIQTLGTSNTSEIKSDVQENDSINISTLKPTDEGDNKSEELQENVKSLSEEKTDVQVSQSEHATEEISNNVAPVLEVDIKASGDSSEVTQEDAEPQNLQDINLSQENEAAAVPTEDETKTDQLLTQSEPEGSITNLLDKEENPTEIISSTMEEQLLGLAEESTETPDEDDSREVKTSDDIIESTVEKTADEADSNVNVTESSEISQTQMSETEVANEKSDVDSTNTNITTTDHTEETSIPMEVETEPTTDTAENPDPNISELTEGNN